MIYRPQRGSYDESRNAGVYLPATKKALARHLDAKVEDVGVKLYSNERDPRNGWERTFIVTFNGWGIGFTNEGVI
jgi:hypothetical protein